MKQLFVICAAALLFVSLLPDEASAQRRGGRAIGVGGYRGVAVVRGDPRFVGGPRFVGVNRGWVGNRRVVVARGGWGPGWGPGWGWGAPVVAVGGWGFNQCVVWNGWAWVNVCSPYRYVW
jgi:hypothetical protein